MTVTLRALLFLGGCLAGATGMHLGSSLLTVPASESPGQAIDPIQSEPAGSPGASEAQARPEERDPALDPLTFQIDALAQVAESDPEDALVRLLASEDHVLKRTAMPVIAAAWARIDPLAALANAGLVTEPRLQEIFTLEILHQWAQVDSLGLLAYLRFPDGLRLPQLGDGVSKLRSTFEILAISNPEQVLGLSRQLSRWNLFDAAVSAAVQSLADRDPAAAVTYLEGLGPGRERRLTRSIVASAYAAADPVAALAWARNLDPPSAATVNDVISAIASMDLERVVDIVVSSIASGNPVGIDSRAWMNQSADSETMARVGSRIASLGADSASQLIPRFAELWSGRDPEAALDWSLANGEVGELMLPHIALNYRQADFAAAMSVADRVPAEFRDTWIQGIVLTTGSRELAADPEAFAAELRRFEGDSSYPAILDRLAASVTMQARTFGNPAEAERIVGALPEGELRTAIEQRLGAGQP